MGQGETKAVPDMIQGADIKRKPWIAPGIEDVSLELMTNKVPNTTETGVTFSKLS